MTRQRLTDRQVQAAGSMARREIPDDFKYNKRKIRHLKKILHSVNVSLGHLISAFDEFSKVKGPDISPDGMLGGLGYVLGLKDVKEIFNEAIKSLSNVADTFADELTNPRWEADKDKEVKKLIKEKEEVEEKAEDVGAEPGDDGSAENDNNDPEDFENEDAEEGESEEPAEESEEEPLPNLEDSAEKEATDKEDESEIHPKDVVTNEKLLSKQATDRIISDIVIKSLLRFESVGTRQNTSKEI